MDSELAIMQLQKMKRASSKLNNQKEQQNEKEQNYYQQNGKHN